MFRPPWGKGKQRALEDKEFEKELVWVRKMVGIEDGMVAGGGGVGGVEGEGRGGEATDMSGVDDDDEGADDEVEESDGEDEENGIECGCCFSKFCFVRSLYPSILSFTNTSLRKK